MHCHTANYVLHHSAACPRLELEAHDAIEPAMDKRDKIRLMDSKMLRIKNGEVAMDDLNPEEMRCLWQRLHTRMGKPDEPAQKITELWKDINANGAGKDAKKKKLLKAWPTP